MLTSTHNLWTTAEARLLARLYSSPILSKALYAAFPRQSVQTFAVTGFSRSSGRSATTGRARRRRGTGYRTEVQIADRVPPEGRAQWRPVWAVGRQSAPEFTIFHGRVLPTRAPVLPQTFEIGRAHV